VRKRVGKRLRHAWPDTWFIFRGDRHLASPEVMAWIEAHPQLSSVTGLTSNPVVPELAHEVVAQAKRASARWGRKATRFHSTRSQAGTWSHSRRVVIKVEVSAQGVTTRFVVTDMEQARTHVLYRHISRARGHMANESKDHKLSLQSERTSCHRFEANPVRLFLHSAAYGLLDTLRREVFRTTSWACATMATLQLRFLKRGARVQECKERIKISLSSSCPVASVLRRCVMV
jgi:Transposase DDE domain group 1